MSAASGSGPPDCQFQSDRLILQMDELIESRIEAISLAVERLMHVLRETCCTPEQEFAVETALCEALANDRG